MKDKILEEIRILNDKYRILSSFLLALLSGISGLIFAFTQNKLVLNISFVLIFIISLILTNIITYRIYKIEKERKKLLEKLKVKKWKKQ